MPGTEDYLTKQIYIDKNVVTFRSLSRQFGLHVNEAKNYADALYTTASLPSSTGNSETRSFATYLISGELFPKPRAQPNGPTQTDDGMDVDSEGALPDAMDEEDEDVPLTTITLVGEKDLEQAKSKYARIFSTHVYCLSPSPLTDAGLICDPSAIVYKADEKDSPISSIALGRVVGPDVRVGKVPPPIASSSKAPEPVSRKPTLKVKSEASPPVKVEKKDEEKPNAIKPKASGKLDWSKAKKSSDADKSKEKEIKVKKEETPAPQAKLRQTPQTSRDATPQDDSKRGTKRKAAPPPASDTEEKPEVPKREPAPVKSDIKLRKNRIVSDDEDEEEARPVPSKSKGRSRASVVKDALESEAEASLRAMMDMDDSQVEKASASRPAPKPAPEVPQEEDDVEMVSEPEPVPPETEQDEEEEEVPKPKPRKKKEKKVIPVGRNGLKKKRVMKTRMTMDAKDTWVLTEDYSEYESVDEEEAEEEQKKPKGKKAAAASKPKKSSDDEPAPGKSKPAARTGSIKGKSTGTKAGAQGSLKDFFGKPKK
ncbi:DNA polymerase subunit Cdc27 [Cerioporus squamosus]|nr:DNA polymerase subunit Cdc27 [Cerioporus squamosus]